VGAFIEMGYTWRTAKGLDVVNADEARTGSRVDEVRRRRRNKAFRSSIDQPTILKRDLQVVMLNDHLSRLLDLPGVLLSELFGVVFQSYLA
jgi:hypothetical protein